MPAHTSANSTAWSLKKSILLRSSQSRRRRASARPILYHKRWPASLLEAPTRLRRCRGSMLLVLAVPLALAAPSPERLPNLVQRPPYHVVLRGGRLAFGSRVDNLGVGPMTVTVLRGSASQVVLRRERSEERRVGKECRS